MCVMSMVMDHYHDEWIRRYYLPVIPLQPVLPFPIIPAVPAPALQPTPAEIDEFRRLLERARQYDRDHNQPDCELEEKRQKLKKLAEDLGVKIDFV
jgi:hypothetical protein